MLKILWPLVSRTAMQKMQRAAAKPQASQEAFLMKLIRANQDTQFGREHGFQSIKTVADYRRQVPIRDYEGFRPYVDRTIAGESRVLTMEEPCMYATTSGTSGDAKMIPITPSFRKALAGTSRYWLSCVLRDHPTALDGGILVPTSPAEEGRTPLGIPYGSMTGLTYKTAPRFFRNAYVVPYEVSLISNYDLRYFVLMRFALERSVTFALTANPSTWVRLAELTRAYGPAFIRAIRDGVMGEWDVGHISAQDEELLKELAAQLRPNPRRAQALEAHLKARGVLTPADAWPDLALLGCWLGGSAGLQARRLHEHYGEVAIRDPGFRASEATMSLPSDDWTSAGLLVNHINYYEFIPEQEMDSENPRVLSAHELEEGVDYYILLSTLGGLYRYDINDLVRVHAKHGETPILAFQRKGRDMANITGEKLHVNQVIEAMRLAEGDCGVSVHQYCLIPNVDAMRYDLLIEWGPNEQIEEPSLRRFLSLFDTHLSHQNLEYEAKRKSLRLAMPTLNVMKSGWSERMRRRHVAAGKRDVQYKWPVLQMSWDEYHAAERGLRLEGHSDP